MTGPLDWASHSCPLTFTTLGVWAAGGEVTSVSRSGGLVAAGEEAGKVRLNIQLGQFSVNPPRLLLEVGGTST